VNDKEIQRVIMQYAFDHQHDHALRIIDVSSIREIASIEINRLRHSLIYLKKEGLIDNITDDYMTIRLTNAGINLIDDKEQFDAQFPLIVTMPEETKRMIINVENLLQGKYNSVLEQFQKAIKFLYDSKPPDSLNCVKEAVGAVEALAKILLNQPSKTLGDLAKPLSVAYLKHPAMEKIIHGIYGVASDIPGARHGAYRTPDFDKYDAEYILNVASSVIIYLMRKEEIGIVEGIA